MPLAVITSRRYYTNSLILMFRRKIISIATILNGGKLNRVTISAIKNAPVSNPKPEHRLVNPLSC